MCLIHAIGGAFTRRPEELAQKLSAKSSDLVKRAFDDIDPERLIDHHVHVAGLGAGGTFRKSKDADVETSVSSSQVQSLYEFGGCD